MANSKIKQILVGTTTYDIEDASAAHLSTSNTFTGTNKFQTKSGEPNDPITTIDAGGVRCQTGSDIGTYYINNKIVHQSCILTLPNKTSTLATTSDIDVKAAGDNTFTGINLFKGKDRTIQFRTLSAGQNDPKTDIGAYGMLCYKDGSNAGTYYTEGKISNGTNMLTLPLKTGTFALTSDIDVKAAGDNTFTGINLFKGKDRTIQFRTLSAGQNDPKTDIGAYGMLCYKDGSNAGTYYTEGKISNGTNMLTLPLKTGTFATTDDIKIKSASLSGTTLTLTI